MKISLPFRRSPKCFSALLSILSYQINSFKFFLFATEEALFVTKVRITSEGESASGQSTKHNKSSINN